MTAYTNILVAVDLGPNSLHVVDTAAQVAKRYDVPLSLVHVVASNVGFDYGLIAYQDLENIILEKARADLAELGERIQVPPARQYVKFGSVKAEILRLIQEIPTDLLILGAHGRHGISGMLGSTVNAILKLVVADVLVVHNP